MFVNLLSKIFRRKNKSEYIRGFNLNLPTVFLCLHWIQRHNTISKSHDISSSPMISYEGAGVDMSNQTVGIQNKQLKTHFHICIQYGTKSLMYLDILVLPKIYATFPCLNW
jgi:hypothetical protein